MAFYSYSPSFVADAAELAQQHHHARAECGQIARIMRQYQQAVGRVGKQKTVQCLMACFAVKTQTLVIFLEQQQIVPRKLAQCIKRGGIVGDAVQLGVLWHVIVHDLLLGISDGWFSFAVDYSRLISCPVIDKIFYNPAEKCLECRARGMFYAVYAADNWNGSTAF